MSSERITSNSRNYLQETLTSVNEAQELVHETTNIIKASAGLISSAFESIKGLFSQNDDSLSHEQIQNLLDEESHGF